LLGRDAAARKPPREFLAKGGGGQRQPVCDNYKGSGIGRCQVSYRERKEDRESTGTPIRVGGGGGGGGENGRSVEVGAAGVAGRAVKKNALRGRPNRLEKAQISVHPVGKARQRKQATPMNNGLLSKDVYTADHFLTGDAGHKTFRGLEGKHFKKRVGKGAGYCRPEKGRQFRSSAHCEVKR